MTWVHFNMSAREIKSFRNEWRRARQARFLVDENLGPEVAKLLRDQFKANVVFGPTVGLGGKSDTAVFAFAWREKRILLTHDDDFLDDRAFPEHRNPGVVVIHPGATGNADDKLIVALFRIMDVMGRIPEIWRGTKVVVGHSGEFTVRQRDAQSGAREVVRYKFGRNDDLFLWKN